MMKKLYILDGSGFLYRSYHAMSKLDITDKDWHKMNAVFGFFRMLIKLLQNKPDYFCIAWDAREKTFRHEQYKEYKANRIQMPDNFHWQSQVIKDLVEEVWLCSMQVSWYEADDIIKTIVDEVDKDDVQVIITSLDKDLKQLLSESVCFFDTMNEDVIDKDKFVQQRWFQPIYMIDYLSLVGDSSDNIPWVKWVGKKTAQDLVSKYWSLDEIYNHIADIWWAMQEKLKEWKDEAYKSKELIKLYTVPDLQGQDLQSLVLNLDFDKFHEVIQNKLGFKSVLKMLQDLKQRYQSWEQQSLFG